MSQFQEISGPFQEIRNQFLLLFNCKTKLTLKARERSEQTHLRLAISGDITPRMIVHTVTYKCTHRNKKKKIPFYFIF